MVCGVVTTRNCASTVGIIPPFALGIRVRCRARLFVTFLIGVVCSLNDLGLGGSGEVVGDLVARATEEEHCSEE